MSDNHGNLTASGDNSVVGSDFFGLYAREIAELLSRDEGRQPYSHQTSHLTEKGKSKIGCRTKDNSGASGSAPFSNGLGALLSEFKKERLKSLLRQSAFTLTQEVDEMIDPVLSFRRISACLRYKESLSSLDASACKVDEPQNASKKLKISIPSSPLGEGCELEKNGSILDSDKDTANEYIEIDDDMKFLLEKDSTRVEELMKKHGSEFSATLHHMEKKLEELLNTVMASYRPMTVVEKIQLRKLIQNLPARNLGRVVEIIGHNKPSEKYSSTELHFDLDEEDTVTLWRLYFYVKTVQGYDTTKVCEDR